MTAAKKCSATQTLMSISKCQICRMAHKRAHLTNIAIKNAKAKSKVYRLHDGEGLCLKSLPSSKKIWEYRFKNPETRKEDTLVLGNYPTISSLSEARNIHQEKRLNVLKGVNPKRNHNNLDFINIFKEWWHIWSQSKSQKYAIQVYNAINKNCMKSLGNLSINQIEG